MGYFVQGNFRREVSEFRLVRGARRDGYGGLADGATATAPAWAGSPGGLGFTTGVVGDGLATAADSGAVLSGIAPVPGAE